MSAAEALLIEVFNKMTNSLLLTTFLLIPGMIFSTIAVVGQSKFGFAEINSGVWWRFLALVFGVACLMLALAEMTNSLPLTTFLFAHVGFQVK
ncbi:hypothetical protein [Chroococcidiopsis sp. CCMEE 29]|uniref:hypothetical protein n=1 Tax=Chroococcidiopsis sp. CCMEE 29 TaxID=155894 RepID=UPI0020224592|nr:hypothetical protein [Chroococcidiopsis sp. CCMEE 29]